MSTDRGPDDARPWSLRVCQTNIEDIVNKLARLVHAYPLDFRGFLGLVRRRARHGGSEDQSNNAEGHVLAGSRERSDLDLGAGLFADLAAHAFLDGLVQFQEAARWFPLAVVAALDEQSVLAALVEGLNRL